MAAQAAAKIRPRPAQCPFSNERTWWNNRPCCSNEWRVEKAEYAEVNGPTCGNIAVWQPCRERQPVWKSCDGLNLTCLDQCHGVRFHGTSTSPGWRKRIVGQSTVQIWVYILVFDEGDFCRFAKESLPTEIGKGRHWTSVFFYGCASSSQDSPKASPMAIIFNWKNMMEELTLEELWWPEFNLFGSMPWCSFPWHKHLPRLAQKKCCTVYHLNLTMSLHPCFRQRWFLQVC